MKKKFYIFFIILLLLTGCSHKEQEVISYDKINEMIEYIDNIPFELDNKDLDYINYGFTLYNQLTEEEKK